MVASLRRERNLAGVTTMHEIGGSEVGGSASCDESEE